MDLPPPQVQCIAQAVYAEAGGESFDGKRAVVHVIMNRSKKQGKEPCSIIKQPYQFKYRSGSGKQWQDSIRAAKEFGKDITAGALYFKAVYSKVRWNHRLTTKIGRHLFYK